MESFSQQDHACNHRGKREQTDQDASIQGLESSFFILAAVVKQINHFPAPDDLCRTQHPKSIHQDEKEKGHSPCTERKQNLIMMGNFKNILDYLIQQSRQSGSQQGTQQKGGAANDMFSVRNRLRTVFTSIPISS